MEAELAKERQGEHTDLKTESDKDISANLREGKAADLAAEKLGISGRSLSDANISFKSGRRPEVKLEIKLVPAASAVTRAKLRQVQLRFNVTLLIQVNLS